MLWGCLRGRRARAIRFLHCSTQLQVTRSSHSIHLQVKGRRAMIDLHYWTTPNGHKITMFLEEAGLPYSIHPVNINKGDQFDPEFLKISPNNRIPAIIDRAPTDGGAPIPMFESGAILLYLADKIRRFVPQDA